MSLLRLIPHLNSPGVKGSVQWMESLSFSMIMTTKPHHWLTWERQHMSPKCAKILSKDWNSWDKSSGRCWLTPIWVQPRSKLEQEQIVGASLLFNISGKYPFILSTMNMSWTPITLKAGGIMNKWTDDEEQTKCLKISIANLSYWLKEFLKLHIGKGQGSTSRAPDITQLQSTTQLLPTTKFQDEEVFIPLGLLSILIAFVFCISMYVKRKSQGEARRSHWIPWNGTYRWLEVLGTEPRSSPRVLLPPDSCPV
ncbi:retinoic acid early-inducible protein 1-delta-like [Onychomys torridus]|uniref:retinoic acid early-inducible protein 1-delta-like n=1 Tax=Onychomys torridus TaxID=38674 RepID=UPI00167FC6AC|nr:retinoic acid early-inducible protein 1-delta-like [Onychomys torridus]